MIRNIHLHGALAERFQACYSLDVETPAEGLYAIMTQVPGFRQALQEGEFVCIRGELERGIECDEELLKLNMGSLRDFHLLPAAVGQGRGGGKILIGIALIGVAVLTGGTALAGIGGMMVLSGAAKMLSPMPVGRDLNEVDDKPGYLFNGAINSAEQGGACPLVFGRIRAGSVVVSAGVIAERMGSTGGGTISPAPDAEILKIIRGLWGNKIGVD